MTAREDERKAALAARDQDKRALATWKERAEQAEKKVKARVCLLCAHFVAYLCMCLCMCACQPGKRGEQSEKKVKARVCFFCAHFVASLCMCVSLEREN